MTWYRYAGCLLFGMTIAAGAAGPAAAQTRPPPSPPRPAPQPVPLGEPQSISRPAPASAPRVVPAAERAARVEIAQQHLRAFLDENNRAAVQPASGEQGAASGMVATIPEIVFEEALVQLAPDAAAEMDALTIRAADAIRAWEADPTQSGLRPPKDVFESTIRLAGAVALAAGEDGTVTAAEAAAAMRGLCPLYPFC